MSTFAATFRELVMPTLKRMCAAHALFVACELQDFCDAHTTVMREAERRGAAHLPDDLRAELDAWIASTILREVEVHMPAVMEQERRGEESWARVLEHEAMLRRVVERRQSWLMT